MDGAETKSFRLKRKDRSAANAELQMVTYAGYRLARILLGTQFAGCRYSYTILERRTILARLYKRSRYI